MEEEEARDKVKWYWKLLIACVALTLASLTAILIPPLPDFTLSSADGLTLAVSVTNRAAAPITYSHVTAAAIVARDKSPAVEAKLDGFQQAVGERTTLVFSMQRPETVTAVVVRARAEYGAAAWPWRETGVEVACVESKCRVDGVWVWRDLLLFVAVFVVPFLMYVFTLFLLDSTAKYERETRRVFV